MINNNLLQDSCIAIFARMRGEDSEEKPCFLDYSAKQQMTSLGYMQNNNTDTVLNGSGASLYCGHHSDCPD